MAHAIGLDEVARNGHSIADTTKEKRAPRACLACRTRKSKCDLDTTSDPRGQPPCRRCQGEGKDCVLTASLRGGRRTKRASRAVPESIDRNAAPAEFVETTNDGMNLDNFAANIDSARARQTSQHETQAQNHSPSNVTNVSYQVPTNVQNDGWSPPAWSRPTRLPVNASHPSHQSPRHLDPEIANQDLLNPSDALEFLGRVQSRGEGSVPAASTPSDGGDQRLRSLHQNPALFPPIANGSLTFQEAAQLIRIYQEKYHPYFPVAYNVLDDGDVMAWALEEPHLLCAVLIIASKDDPSSAVAHSACAAYMESLVVELMNRGSTSVGAVEALLILAEWAPQRMKEKHAIGLGEEDQGSWMQVGCAVRLGYLQRLEETGLARLKNRVSDKLSRQRLAWAACYMSDRQISIRLGKGFWSRGPGPSTVLRAADFPTLQARGPGSDDLALLFQAHIELTQLFSNAHDILYSSSSHREALYMGGEYVRYIDDFSATLRNWKIMWGSLSFTPYVKATLILTYEFLRLYVNAFAFQATINREIARARDDSSSSDVSLGPLFANVASSPDARFIYESIDAANSLIGTLNSFIDPVHGLRYMPLKYYLYVVHAAVFLFKARSAGTLGADTSTMVSQSIETTIDRLRQSSVDSNGPGHRYAHMLYLLWREHINTPGVPNVPRNSTSQSGQQTPRQQNPPDRLIPAAATLDPLNGFSWRDLSAVGNYVTQGMEVTTMGLGGETQSNDLAIGDGFTAGWDDQAWFANDIVF